MVCILLTYWPDEVVGLSPKFAPALSPFLTAGVFKELLSGGPQVTLYHGLTSSE
jgi:hypothetical protein